MLKGQAAAAAHLGGPKRAWATLRVDVLVMSPPWGGPKYQHVHTFDCFYPLVGFNRSLVQLLDATMDCVRHQLGAVVEDEQNQQPNVGGGQGHGGGAGVEGAPAHGGGALHAGKQT
ncbi:hypothetical protein TSOC_000930 [Tetrabaena socialis]|uniref:Trimethylguanosine synthase n=1 Tax=Tetrabaena socialis TaxID=47790 RepID=A0A2J8AI00_9CHLO|nr:hypothetical protein TSOC_000930 [Tetrabaena socialis]|eukprot:PNH12137.1 hypothetical protein TSOC_000930 [Tetrabaena socialis]